MNINEKIALFQKLNSTELLRVELLYDILEKCDALKTNYYDFSTTHPIDCDTELLRLPTMTMFLTENN